MGLSLSISQHGRPFIESINDEDDSAPGEGRGVESAIRAAFGRSPSAGLLHLATEHLQATLPASLDFARGLARDYLTRLCRMPELADREPATASAVGAVPPPSDAEL